MKAFYELPTEYHKEPFLFTKNFRDFPLHYHINIEIAVLLSGNIEVICNGKLYSMKAGDIAFFDSYDIHGYKREGKGDFDDYILLLPISYIGKYKSEYDKKRVACPIISDEKLARSVVKVMQEFIKDGVSLAVKKSAVNLVLSMISEKLVFVEDGFHAETDVVRATLQYLHKFYKEDIKLTEIAKELGYSPEHVSRVFNKYAQCSVTTYINKLRLEYVNKNIGKQKITSLIFEAGFKSLQSYYRNKKRFEEC